MNVQDYPDDENKNSNVFYANRESIEMQLFESRNADDQEMRSGEKDSKRSHDTPKLQLYDNTTNKAKVPEAEEIQKHKKHQTKDNINLDQNIIRSKENDFYNAAMASQFQQAYYGQGFVENMKELNDQQKREQMTGKQDNMGTATRAEELFNKKQIEFKGGKVHQIITDQRQNSNKIYANRYQGLIGIWYFFLDTTVHFENILAILLLVMIKVSQEYNQIEAQFALIALFTNIGLMTIRNITFELRQRKVTNKINNKFLRYLLINRKIKRFLPITWADIKPGYIIQIKSGQEFPADCLILDITGAVGQKCYVTAGPFDESTGIIQKRSYSNVSLKTREKNKEEYLEQLLSGIIKYEYNYFGYIQGSFKHNDNPTALEFDHDNVVQRGAVLTQTPMVTCLVLNVGDQCMGSVYKDPKQSGESYTNLRLRSMVKTQRSFDKAYKHSIRLFLMGLALLYMVFAGIAVYLATNNKLFQVSSFEQHVMMIENEGVVHYIVKSLGFFSILLSSIPLSFSNIIDLLVLCHTNFAEWDINIQQANIEFIYPHATLAFGKVAHMFLSRTALQRDDKQCVKVFHIGGHFFLNQIGMISQQYDDVFFNNRSYSDSDVKQNQDDSEDIMSLENETIDYLPNELKFTKLYKNDEAESILKGPETKNKILLTEFFRGITLCHQASVQKNLTTNDNSIQYIGVFHDELASLDFATQQDFKLYSRGKKLMTLHFQGNQEKYEELGVVTTKAVMGHFMTVCAVRLQGQQAGFLYMKGSIATLKHYFVNRDSDFKYLNHYEQKFIQSGVQAIVYAKRKLTIDETNQLIITINEGVQNAKENVKLDKMLYNLTSIQLEILGILGLQKAIHLRNRVTVDDMVLNGVKPWIVSKEDEQSHLTSLNSLRLFQNCNAPLVINGQRERVVMDQIQNALKSVTDRMSEKTMKRDDTLFDDNITNLNSNGTTPTIKQSNRPGSWLGGESKSQSRLRAKDKEIDIQNKKTALDLRNVVIFTGKALVEIFRDQTMQKSFLTLAYISDIMVGSEISPIQKQRLIKMAKAYIGEGEYVSAILSGPEDQFMVNEADLTANFKQKGKSVDFQAVVDVTIKDFSAISYLLFKHGNQIQMRLSKAAQAFFYRSLISFLILFTYMIQSGFSGAIPYTDLYYIIFMIFLAPLEILVYSIFYKDIGYDYLYRIYGHYKYNFSFSLVEKEFVIVEIFTAMYDWIIIYMPFEIFYMGAAITTQGGKNTNHDAYNCTQVILMQVTFFMYLKNTNVQVIQSLTILFVLSLVGMALIFNDEGISGVTQLFFSPLLLLSLTFQILMLTLRNVIVEVSSKILVKKQSKLLEFYQTVEEKLSFEEYEDPDQIFHIQQYPPLFKKINSKTIQNTLKLINTNMMKIPKTEGLEQILDRINTELDLDRRGMQQVAMSGAINKLTLQLNDLNKETEYQDSKNSREIIYVKRQMVVFIITTLFFCVLGICLSIFLSYTNIGIYYYISLTLLSSIVYYTLPRALNYLSNVMLFYTVVVIFFYTIYTAQSESLQPTGLINVLALVAGLNHSFIYITIFMISLSVAMHMFFSFLTEEGKGQLNAFIKSFNVFIWVVTSLIWSAYVYVQELEKKTQFVNAHRRVRQFLKLKSILNILVPSLVRDKVRAGKKGFSDDEGEVTVILIDIAKFDSIVQCYTGIELLQFLDQIYNVFDSLCDQFGLQKIETVGKTYLACGGLKSAEKKIDTKLLNRHHSVRATDFAMEVSNYVKSIFLRNGEYIEVRIGIHSGQITSGVIGETKPQFTLLGDTLNKTFIICKGTKPNTINISQETHHFLELYTNNFSFIMNRITIKESVGPEIIYTVSGNKFKERMAITTTSKALKNFDGQLIKEDEQVSEGDDDAVNNYNQHDDMAHNESYYGSERNERDRVQHEKLYNNLQFEEKDDVESTKTDVVEDGSMNVFGFADDLNLDDRQIIKNASDNQIYNLVERPKYLMTFEFKDIEQEFQYNLTKTEARKTSIYLGSLIIINKIVIFGDIFEEATFKATPQFYLMFAIICLEIWLIWKLNSLQFEQVHMWTYMLMLYFLVVLGVLLSYQIKYLGYWTLAGINELQIQLTLSLLFMMRNMMLRHFVVVYLCYFLTWILFVSLYSKKFEYQIVQFLLGQVMYSCLLATGIHHREMIQRKQLNYERTLNVEINKTNDLIQKLVPYHMLNVMRNEKRQVDEFEDLTILNAKVVGIQQVGGAKDIVSTLQKIFSRFDQLCEDNKVYKVHTIEDHYIVMGYTGRIDKNKRYRGIIVDEVNRTIQTGLEMVQIVNEIKEANKKNMLYQDLDIMIGISSGRVVAGIIGSKVVRYDIFGEGVYVANKVVKHGSKGKVCVSEDTLKILSTQPDVANEYTWSPFTNFNLNNIKKIVKTFEIERKETDSYIKSQLSNEEEESMMGSKHSKNSNQNVKILHRSLNHSGEQLMESINEHQSQKPRGYTMSDSDLDDEENMLTSRPLKKRDK